MQVDNEDCDIRHKHKLNACLKEVNGGLVNQRFVGCAKNVGIFLYYLYRRYIVNAKANV